MIFRLLAGAVVMLHLAFVAFVVFGGLLALRWRRAAWLHLPAAGWGALVELAGWVCPLTPLEMMLRVRGGGAGYTGGFVDRYLVPILYPASLDRRSQIVLGAGVVLVNAVIYAFVFRRPRASAGR